MCVASFEASHIWPEWNTPCRAKIAMTKRGDMACIGENELFHSDHEGVISNESVLWPGEPQRVYPPLRGDVELPFTGPKGFANVVQYNDRFPGKGNPLKDHKGDIEPFRVQRARFRFKPLDPNKNNGDKHPEPINPHLIGFKNLYYWRVNFKTDPKEAKKADGGLVGSSTAVSTPRNAERLTFFS